MVDDKPGGKVFDIYQRGRVTEPMVHVLSLINDVVTWRQKESGVDAPAAP